MSFCSRIYATFRDFYYVNKFNTTISIRDEAVHFQLRPEEEGVRKAIRELVDTDVHQFLIDNGALTTYRAGLVSHKKFRILGTSVLDQELLQGWLLKGGGRNKHIGPMLESGVKNSQGTMYTNNFSNLLRVPMAARMQKVVTENHLTEIMIPEKRLVRSHICDVYSTEKDFFGKPRLAELHEQYYVLSRKVETLDFQQTEEALSKMAPDRLRNIARQICKLIMETGFADAHTGNIQLTKDLRKVVILDTEPHGAMREKSDRSPNCTLSINHCALIGLKEFGNRFKEISPIFQEESERAIQEVKSKIFWKRFKIVASFVLPIIPLALLIIGICCQKNNKLKDEKFRLAN